MATVPAQSKRRLVRAVARLAHERGVAVAWTKPQLAAVFDAIESYAEDTPQDATMKAGVGSAIEGAAAGVFNTTAKTWLWAIWSTEKAARLGVDPGLIVSAFGE